jgi:2-desacetyl-2-hydroxyethyl bacteriochlorophyllide A dehydrogenase
MVRRIKRRALFFSSPGQVTVRDEMLPSPKVDQVLVQTQISAISPGTEMLLYRGQFPAELAVDPTIPDLSGGFQYPLKYGYSVVGKVTQIGEDVDPTWLGKEVFAFHPHESHFISSTQVLHPLPEGVSIEDALFLPNMETAVNFLLDSRPLIGERVVVLGQGIVGLLTTTLLAWFPLSQLVTLDRFQLRRQASLTFGAHHSLDPDSPETNQFLESLLPGGADLVFELSGNPQALNQAIQLAGYSGRVIVGSWYGTKGAELKLGEHFHRERIHLISSQVSSLTPELSGRWDKPRRLQVAWEALAALRPSRLITQRIPLEEAPKAYQLVDQEPENTIQVILNYNKRQ